MHLDNGIKELPKAIILLHHTKSTFGLDRAIHAKQYPLFAGDSFQGFRPLLNELLGNMDGGCLPFLSAFGKLYIFYTNIMITPGAVL